MTAKTNKNSLSNLDMKIIAGLAFFALLLRILFLEHGTAFHPDERHIIMVTQKLSYADPNPHSFAYGSLLFYTLKGVSTFLSWWSPKLLSYDNLFIVGRICSALFGTFTVLIAYLFGKQLFGKREPALLGAALLAVNVSHLQLSHFYVSDVPLTLFCTLALYFSVKIAKAGRIADYTLFAVCTGLALAFKIAALALFIPLGCAHIVHKIVCKKETPLSLLYLVAGIVPLIWVKLFSSHPGFFEFVQVGVASIIWMTLAAWVNQLLLDRADSLRSLMTLSLVVVLAGIVFVSCAPYVILDWPNFLKDVTQQISMVNGTWIPPYTRQYQNTTPYLYHIQQMGMFAIGWGILTVCALGIVTAVVMIARKPLDLLHLTPPLIWMAAMFFVIGGKQVKFPRYLLPLYPSLLLFGGFFLARFRQTLQKNTGSLIQHSLTVVIAGLALVRGLAFIGIYTEPHTYRQASNWVYDNIPPRSTILGVHWDDKVPLSMPGKNSHIYKMWGAAYELPLYEPDNLQKRNMIISKLLTADYIIFPTDRLPGSILQVKEQYPETSSFIRQLYAGNLGFELVQTVKINPSFLGITFNDLLADESFSVYDHPRVSIFKKTQKLSRSELTKRILEKPQTPTRSQVLLMETGQDFSADIGWGCLLLVGWLVTWELLGLVGLPLCLFLCRGYPDKGAGLAKCLGIFLLGFTVWILNVAGVPSSVMMVRIVFLVLVAAAILILEKQCRESSAPDWRLFREPALIWYGLIALFLLTRALHPEIHWGEKPMDFSFLNYFSRITFLPPEDPWAVGNTMSYYYFGPYLMAMLHKLTGIPNRYLYNLAIGAVGALVATSAYTTAAKLSGSKKLGVTGALLIALSANPETILIALQEFYKPLLVCSAMLLIAYCGWLLFKQTKSLFQGAVSLLVLFLGSTVVFLIVAQQVGTRLAPYSHRNGFDLFWAGTRLFASNGFNEYPLWSVLFADLHAHVIAVPFTLLFLGLLVGLGAKGTSLIEKIIQHALLGIVLGSLFMLNVWDFLTYFTLFSVAVVALIISTLRKDISALLPQVATALITPLVAVTVVFIFNLSSPTSQPLHWGWVYKSELNNIFSHLRMFGFAFLLLAICIPLTLKYQGLKKQKLRLTCAILLALLPFATPLITQGVYQGSLVLQRTFGFAGVALRQPPTDAYPILIYMISSLCFFSAVLLERSHAWLAVLLIVAGGVFTGVETIYLIDRMNTIFKFFNATWIILVLAAVTSVALLAKSSRGAKGKGAIGAALSLGVMLLMLTSGFINIASMITHRRVPGYRPTLDGMAFLSDYRPDDLKLINFLNANIKEPLPIIEAQGHSYGDFGRIVMYTGLPAYIGWEHHVRQRGLSARELTRRTQILRTAYSAVDPKSTHAILKKEGIKLIVVGKLENQRYPGAGLLKFFQNPELFEILYRDGNYGIFLVK